MNGYTPDDLSPVAVTPTPCDLPYALTWDDLGYPDDATCSITHRKQGLHGGDNSCILTLRPPERTVFVKRSPREAPHYRFLAEHAVSTPELLASTRDIIVTSFVPQIGVHFDRPDEQDDMLRLIAKLNTIDHAPDGPPQPSTPAEEFRRRMRQAFDALPDEDADLWMRAYTDAQTEVNAMPPVLTHGEFFFQQVGRVDGRAVLLDLETLALGPRFCDIASILRALAVRSGRDQRELFGVYLDAAGLHLDRETQQELRLVSFVTGCWSLPWHVSRGGDDLHEMVVRLQEDLREL